MVLHPMQPPQGSFSGIPLGCSLWSMIALFGIRHAGIGWKQGIRYSRIPPRRGCERLSAAVFRVRFLKCRLAWRLFAGLRISVSSCWLGSCEDPQLLELSNGRSLASQPPGDVPGLRPEVASGGTM